MRRGFKTEAERIAVAARTSVGLSESSPLPARSLAKALSVVVIGPRDIPGIPEPLVTQMLFEFARNWSGVTIPVDGQTLIIYNSTHGPARQESDLMHEMAHILCEHKPAKVEPPGKLPWASRTYDAEQEEQAAWLGGALQIPRAGLVSSISQELDNAAIAELFGASLEMVRFRRNTSGVDVQMRRRASYRRVSYGRG
jgi:hypothetical protein